MPKLIPIREQILNLAIKHTMGDRNKSYGPPVINLGDIAELWTAYLAGKAKGRQIGATGGQDLAGQFELTAEDVAWMNVLQKMARTFQPELKQDNYEDATAYSAIAGECANDERKS